MWNTANPSIKETAGTDDVVNGVLLDHVLHVLFDCRMVAILKVCEHPIKPAIRGFIAFNRLQTMSLIQVISLLQVIWIKPTSLIPVIPSNIWVFMGMNAFSSNTPQTVTFHSHLDLLPQIPILSFWIITMVELHL